MLTPISHMLYIIALLAVKEWLLQLLARQKTLVRQAPQTVDLSSSTRLGGSVDHLSETSHRGCTIYFPTHFDSATSNLKTIEILRCFYQSKKQTYFL